MGGEEASGREERERDRDRERDTESRERLKRHPSVFHSRAEKKERTAREGSTTEEDQQSSFLSSPTFHLSVFLNGKRKDREKKGKEAETKAESLALPDSEKFSEQTESDASRILLRSRSEIMLRTIETEALDQQLTTRLSHFFPAHRSTLFHKGSVWNQRNRTLERESFQRQPGLDTGVEVLRQTTSAARSLLELTAQSLLHPLLAQEGAERDSEGGTNRTRDATEGWNRSFLC